MLKSGMVHQCQNLVPDGCSFESWPGRKAQMAEPKDITGHSCHKGRTAHDYTRNYH